jgi:hypothetical protein
MKLNVDWKAMLKAMLNSAWTFIAGALTALISGCTVGGVGPNFF